MYSRRILSLTLFVSFSAEVNPMVGGGICEGKVLCHDKIDCVVRDAGWLLLQLRLVSSCLF